MPENMESPHVDYESQIFLRGKEVDLAESKHPLSWYQYARNSNSYMSDDTRELDSENESVTTDALLDDVQSDPIATP